MTTDPLAELIARSAGGPTPARTVNIDDRSAASRRFDDELRGMIRTPRYTEDAFTGREVTDTPPAAEPASDAERAAVAAGLPAVFGSRLVGNTRAELLADARAFADAIRR